MSDQTTGSPAQDAAEIIASFIDADLGVGVWDFSAAGREAFVAFTGTIITQAIHEWWQGMGS